jgi:hypothetical protein
MAKAILNLNANFFAHPSFHGNGFVNQHVNFTGNQKREKWESVENIVSQLPFNRKRGNMFKKTKSLLFEFQQFDLSEYEFFHIGMHNHCYSYKSWAEFEYMKNPQQYKDYNAFLYLFKEKGLREMTWIFPDYFTNAEFEQHFQNSFFKQKGRQYTLNFKSFEAAIYTTRFRDFISKMAEYDILYFTFTMSEPNLLEDNDIAQIRLKIG